MSERVKIDLITEDPKSGEFVLYLVEEGPWIDAELSARLRLLQSRIYNAIDVAIDGHLAAKYPESHGKPVRIQVDLQGDAPESAEQLVIRFDEHIHNSNEHRRAIEKGAFITGLRIISSSQFKRQQQT